MTAAELVGPHTGSHCPPPSPITLFFRRALRMAWRKPVAPEMPEGVRSGAAGSTWGDAPLPDDTASFAALHPDGHARTDWDHAPSALAWHAAALRRPVNGRNLGTQPRIGTPEHPPWMTAPMPRLPVADEYLRRPVYGERPVADVLAAEQEITYHRADHDEIDRQFTDRPELALLRRVRAGLLKAS